MIFDKTFPYNDVMHTQKNEMYNVWVGGLQGL
jgi:hypothetical protein